MGTVLIFHMNVFKAAQITALCQQLGLEARVMKQEQEQTALGKLLEMNRVQEDKKRPAAAVESEMLVFHSIEDVVMNTLLGELRSRNLRVDLKAVLTPTNMRWTAQQLYVEIKREQDAFAAAGKTRE